MTSGRAIVKSKSIKYLAGGKFELTLTDVEPNDVMELLACSGQCVSFDFFETYQTERGYESKPESGRLFTTDGKGVVQSVEPVPAVASEPAAPTNGIYICESCGLHVGEPLAECPECKGALVYHDCTSEDTVVEIDESAESIEAAKEANEIEAIFDTVLAESLTHEENCYNDPEESDEMKFAKDEITMDEFIEQADA
jgi:hypothetical protein